MSLREENLGFALLKAVADSIYARMAELREEHLESLLSYYAETGNKSFSVALPDGTKVATITLPENKEFFEVEDDAAFLAWCMDNHPEWVDEVVIPPQPEQRFSEVNKATATRWLKGLSHQGETPFDPATGEVPAGVVYRPTGRPSQFQVRFEGPQGSKGRADVIDAWRRGELAGLVGNDVLPQIGKE